MQERLESLLKGINLANFDGVKTLDVEIEDLMFLREVIKDYRKALAKANREIHILSAKLALKGLESNPSLRSYCLDIKV